MVRLLFTLTSSAVAMEQTGLLQATVGVHDQLAVKSDKVSAMRKISKAWEQKAKSLAIPTDGKDEPHGQAALDAVTTTMEQIVETDCPAQKLADQQLLSKTFDDEVTAVDNTLRDTVWPTFEDEDWTKGVCVAGVTNKDCYDDLRTFDNAVLKHCAEHDTVAEKCADQNPLCDIKSDSNAYQTVLDNLKKAKSWYDSYHDESSYNSEMDGEPAYSFKPWNSLVLGTSAHIAKEREQCHDYEANRVTTKTDCEGKQRTYETDFCTYASDCTKQYTTYLQNRQTGIDEYEAMKDLIVDNTESNQARNIDVCFGALKVQCWVNVIREHRGMDANPAFVPVTDTAVLRDFTLDTCQDYNPEPYCTSQLTLDPPAPQPPIAEEDLPCRERLTDHSTPSGDGHDYYYKVDSTETCQNNVDFLADTEDKSFIAPAAWTRSVANYGYTPRLQCTDTGVVVSP
jgi:hypothetical protein